MRSARVTDTRVNNADAQQAQQRRMPTAGKIRPGIKVLTRKALAVDGLAEIYQRGIEAGASFDDIAKHLKQVKGCPPYPLAPQNAPSFRVLQSDFIAPGAADTILSAYGEKRENDDHPQLYSFPIVFPSDDLDLIFTETFEAWKATELHRWSEPDPQTGILQCMHRVDPDPRAKRKQWGGRRRESLGPCNPNTCDLFGADQCKHVGSLYFWIPGIMGIGLIQLTFTSIYTSIDIAEKIALVRAGLGHVKGTHDGKPIFRVTKTRDRVSRVDWEKGTTERSEQWIIRLEADLDMVAVLSGSSQPKIAAPEATPELAGPPAESEQQPAEPEPQSDAEPQSAESEPAPTAESAPAPQSEDIDVIAALRIELSDQFKTLGWNEGTIKKWVRASGFAEADLRDAEKLQIMIVALNALISEIEAETKKSELEAEKKKSSPQTKPGQRKSRAGKKTTDTTTTDADDGLATEEEIPF